MPDPSPANESSRLSTLLTSLATEIVLAQAGSADGQFPILDLLRNLQEEAAAVSALQPLQAAARAAWETFLPWVESGQPFTGEQISWLNATMIGIQRLADAPNTPAAHGASQAAPTPAQAIPPSPGAAATDSTVEQAPLVLNLPADADLLREFIIESREHLNNIEQGVLVLEQRPEDAPTLHTIFRAFHTFKGGAGFLNLAPINRLAHVLESLLDRTRQGSLAITPPIIDLILRGHDTLRQFVNEIDAQLTGEAPLSPIVIPTAQLKESVRALVESPPASNPAPPEAAPPQAELPVLDFPQPAASPAAESTPGPTERDDARQVPVPLAPQSLRSANPPTSAPAAGRPSINPSETPRSAPATAAPSATIKVDIQKLDAMMDLVGELVIAQSVVAQSLGQVEDNHSPFARHLTEVSRITKELQRVSLSLRMVPIRGAFQKMARVVRDLAARQGKQIQYVTAGEDTELDRNMVEEISDPLLHLIRNSVDHGIESAEQRLAAGKPGQGVIHLRASHQSGNIVIEIGDDGTGLNRDRILAKALERGLVSPNTHLSDTEVFALIFLPGFSTAQTITDVSGRGVGLDVVRRNIEKLRGYVEVQSVPGQGATFKLVLPLTLAIIDGLVLGVGDERYIVPTLAVRESFRPRREQLSTVQGRGELVNVRGHLIPLLRLHALFGLRPAAQDPTAGLVLVVHTGGSLRCILVDRLLHKQEVVIKSLSETIRLQNPALAGAAILGDGRVGLILDANALAHLHLAPLRQAA
jgi:two-component system, chemotaxis family, sensor kinase CheA